MTTRFTEETAKQNAEYRQRKNVGCIYCSPTKITQKIPYDSVLFVLELNITKNKIMGIGICKNVPKYGLNVYDNGNYNRYVYKGGFRIDREEMTEKEEQIMQIFDMICFYGRSHLKRGSGITHFPSVILYKITTKQELETHNLTEEEQEVLYENSNIVEILKHSFKTRMAGGGAEPRRVCASAKI